MEQKKREKKTENENEKNKRMAANGNFPSNHVMDPLLPNTVY